MRFEGGLVRCVGGAEVAVLAAQFGCCEVFDACYAVPYVGEEGGVCGEKVEGVLEEDVGVSGDEEEMYAEELLALDSGLVIETCT